MPTDEELRRHRTRQAWWLRIVRMTDPRQPTLSEAAEAAGLKAKSGSVVSLWERDPENEGPKRSRLLRLAAFYGVPASVFTDPLPTDEERLAELRGQGDVPGVLAFYRQQAAGSESDRMEAAARAATALAHEDSPVEEAESDPPVGLRPREQRRRPQA